MSLFATFLPMVWYTQWRFKNPFPRFGDKKATLVNQAVGLRRGVDRNMSFSVTGTNEAVS